MSGAWLQLAVFLLVLFAAAWPLGRAIEAVMDGRFALGRRVEAPLFRLAGVDPAEDQPWTRYALGLLVFNGLGLLAVYALQRLQPMLPLNPQDWPAVAPDSALNTAVSFVTNTNWQGYGGETTMSRLTQMLGLAVQNFLSAATGIAVAVALARGFARRTASGIGNVWADLTRATLWILLPLSLLAALFFVSQGVVQTFAADTTLVTAEGRQQTLALGPVASQLAIKLLGTNGGGYFNANSAHPFENPTALANAVQMLAILLIPAALCFSFGRIVGDARQGWALLGAMTLLFVVAVVAVTQAEYAGNPLLPPLGVDTLPSALQAGGSMEGKEVRFGLDASALFAAVTTAASCGAVNTMHDSLTPLGGAVPLVLMQLGEVVFGGVGSGLYGMLVFALLAVFIAGLMIGRTPEYLGKKIEAHEMKLVSIAILVTPLLVLGGTALAVSVEPGRAGILNPGAHGFSEVLYALTSAANNNGSAFAGLSANTPFYNLMLAVAMWLGRFGVIVPVLALAGALAAKPRLAVTRGTLPTHGALFVALLVGIVLLVGLLNYVPALALGPVAEHLALWAR
ncbi:potassium-transporting ATPase subunit KdpA [Rubrivivax benzoatilyticus]|uniref:Potassium-transporting ATPase potassium-binding subunit n=1 Tax=Rubrivivax benzoatilyticus TaxID=316997 RepID=A0ABX0HYS2_9BURK|nr:potassium-transporting ATPase subunit KdpA [Rubrivivax benzoatilyticus]EGJ09631.1 potassium-transporting ATPase subunit A [Rubrivivax benzoatilyticus JA2 = ATCC BAA-35]NHL00164.1 potassium-transporting ATPase subunit KdpA [Rubrivivax benzoatilyticus]NHL26057.1 potassium-transporting ATPase subunit KdpA [Rubrivivax benzoatilyticus]